MEDRKTYVYGHVFESLTAGLYPNKQEILREYVQNAYDAIVAARRRGQDDANLIRIQTDSDSLFVHDEGIGMDEEGIEEYRYFGFSRKVMDENVGFRGIGKLAGLAVAERMVVVTKRAGNSWESIYTCEARQMLEAVRKAKQKGINIPLDELIETYSSIEKRSAQEYRHYTSVQLYGIQDKDGYLTHERKVREYVSTVAPVPFDTERFRYANVIEDRLKKYLPRYLPVDIQVNGRPVFKPFNDGLPLEDLRFVEVPGRNGPRAICWYLAHREAKQIPEDLPRGLSYRCKGFAVGDENLVRNTIFSAGRAGMVYWYAGEVHVLDEGLVPSSSRTEFEDSPSRASFYEAARENIAKPLNTQANARSQLSSFQKESTRATARIKEVNKKIDQQALAPEMKDKVVAELTELKERLISKASLVKDPEKKREASVKAKALDDVTRAVRRGEGVTDIATELNLRGEALVVYHTIMATAKSWFTTHAPDDLEPFVDAVHRALKRRG